jgi:hypothetical protein
MLLRGRQPDIRQVAVVTRSLQFNKLLSRILADWKFFTVADLSAANVIIAERGLDLPAHNAHVVWLTSMPLREGSFLMVPICLTQLYHSLEIHLFPIPRRHIRVAMETAVDLQLDNNRFAGQLVSLSGRGGRITCAHEIPCGKMLHIEVKLAGRFLKIQSEVLYCIPAGDSSSRRQPHVGVLFKPSNGYDFDMLRRFIEKISIERACAREDILSTDLCLTWLDVTTNPWDAKDA